jgi:AbrB family looped-hinge helix DNA binding protein
MRTTIDSAGRIVVPKPLRDELGFSAGQELELRQGDLVSTTAREMPDLPPEVVRETLERIRR